MTTSAPTGRDRDAIASAPQVLEGDVLPPADDREPEDVEGTLERLDGNFEDEFGYGLEDHEVRTARGILGSITDPRKAYQVTRNTIARDRREGVTA